MRGKGSERFWNKHWPIRVKDAESWDLSTRLANARKLLRA